MPVIDVFGDRLLFVRLFADLTEHDKTTIGGEGVGRFVHATAFEAATFEHAFCPTIGAGLTSSETS